MGGLAWRDSSSKRRRGWKFDAHATSPLAQIGLRDLDHLLGGLRPGLTVALTGGPGVGKSALLFTIALHTASSGHSTTLLSHDLPLPEVAGRLVAVASEVPLQLIRTRALDARRWAAIAATRERRIPLRGRRPSPAPLTRERLASVPLMRWS